MKFALGLAAAVVAAGVTAACSGEAAPDAAATPTAPPPALPAKPRTMIAADFSPEELGGRVAGAQVTEAPVGDGARPFARISAYVACSKEHTRCESAGMPAGTRYSYVVTITPSVPIAAGAGGDGDPAPVPAVMPVAGSFATTAPAAGFEGAVGYSLEQAADALGSEDAIAVTLEDGRITWRVAGGQRWLPGKPITVWWQSTRPPAGIAPAYDLAIGTDTARVSVPTPAADNAVDRAADR